MGSTLKSMSDVLANESTAKTATFVFFIQLVIAIGVMFYILQAARNELNQHIENSSNKFSSEISSSISTNSSSSMSSGNLLSASSGTDVEECKSLIGSTIDYGVYTSASTGFLIQTNQNETSTHTNKLYELS